MLTVHCDQNNSYEITINGFQGFPQNIWISSSTQLGEHPNFGLNAEEGFPLRRPKIKFLISFIFLT